MHIKSKMVLLNITHFATVTNYRFAYHGIANCGFFIIVKYNLRLESLIAGHRSPSITTLNSLPVICVKVIGSTHATFTEVITRDLQGHIVRQYAWLCTPPTVTSSSTLFKLWRKL